MKTLKTFKNIKYFIDKYSIKSFNNDKSVLKYLQYFDLNKQFFDQKSEMTITFINQILTI